MPTTDFVVSRAHLKNVSGYAAFNYIIAAGSGSNPAQVSDFPDGRFPQGTVYFLPRETSKTVQIPLSNTAVPGRSMRMDLYNPAFLVGEFRVWSVLPQAQ
jgi:hypothetical protein